MALTSVPRRSLTAHVVGLSVSESADSDERGFPEWRVNDVTLRVVRSLFGQGSAIVFGHDWRPDGVMAAVHSYAAALQSVDQEASQVPLRNLVPWPDVPALSEDEQAKLARTLAVEAAGLPNELNRFSEVDPDTLDADSLRYLRARGLTHLRRRLTALCNARLCIGGRTENAQGRYPGIVEEAFLTIEYGKPLFLSGLLGGATSWLINAIRGKEMPSEAEGPIVRLFRDPPPHLVEHDPDTAADRRVDLNNVWAHFRDLGIAGIAYSNGLTTSENEFLFDTPSIEDVVDLVLIGLSRRQGLATGE